jgi:hypothetical protein
MPVESPVTHDREHECSVALHQEGNMSRAFKHLCLATTGFVAMTAASTMAFAHSYERCDADGDHCVRITCDHDGDRCWRESEYSKRDMYNRPGRWVCDADGDRCHYEYAGRPWHPHWEHREHDDDRDQDRYGPR